MQINQQVRKDNPKMPNTCQLLRENQGNVGNLRELEYVCKFNIYNG